MSDLYSRLDALTHAGLTQTCEQCNGSGIYSWYDRDSEREYLEGLKEERCPMCSGRGWTIPDNINSQAIDAFFAEWIDHDTEATQHGVRAALVSVVEGLLGDNK